MTNLDIESPQQRGEIDIISKADRYALLKMLDEKPRAIISAALRDAARRGIFVDRMLDVAPPRSTSFARRAFKSTVLTGSLLALVWLAYIGSREYLASPQKTQSVMGIKLDDATKTVSKEEADKNDIAYARLSEPARNAFKNYVPESDGNTIVSKNCAFLEKQSDPKSIVDKTTPAMRPTEPANKWVERMTTMNKAGKVGELQTELKKFRQAYPGIALPRELQALAC